MKFLPFLDSQPTKPFNMALQKSLLPSKFSFLVPIPPLAVPFHSKTIQQPALADY